MNCVKTIEQIELVCFQQGLHWDHGLGLLNHCNRRESRSNRSNGNFSSFVLFTFLVFNINFLILFLEMCVVSLFIFLLTVCTDSARIVIVQTL